MQSPKNQKQLNEKLLFLKKMFLNPKKLGAIMPSSKNLAKMIVDYIDIHSQSFIVEVGAGTGSFTQSLLNAGVHQDHLIVVELDPDLCHLLRYKFPHLTIIQGDARDLPRLLPSNFVGKVRHIISGIPLINCTKQEKEELFNSFQRTIQKDGTIIQFTYGLFSPICLKSFAFDATRVGYVFKNIPPATVWAYTPLQNMK